MKEKQNRKLYENNMNELLNISTYCNIPLTEIVKTYNDKITKNIDKTLKLEHDIDSIDIVYESARVFSVMVEYASRKLGYDKGDINERNNIRQ